MHFVEKYQNSVCIYGAIGQIYWLRYLTGDGAGGGGKLKSVLESQRLPLALYTQSTDKL